MKHFFLILSALLFISCAQDAEQLIGGGGNNGGTKGEKIKTLECDHYLFILDIDKAGKDEVAVFFKTIGGVLSGFGDNNFVTLNGKNENGDNESQIMVTASAIPTQKSEQKNSLAILSKLPNIEGDCNGTNN